MSLPSDAIKARLFELRKRGFNRLFQNEQVFEFSSPESLLDINFSEPVFGLVDRLVVAADQRSRIVDAVEIGYREAGEVIFETAPRDGESSQRLGFSHRFECKNDGTRYTWALTYDPEAVKKRLRKEGVAALLGELDLVLAKVEPFEPPSLEQAVHAYAERTGRLRGR